MRTDHRCMEAKLLAYCALAGGSLAVAQPAEAAIVYSGIKNLAVGSGSPQAGIDFDNDNSTECAVHFSTILGPFASTQNVVSISCTSGSVVRDSSGTDIRRLEQGAPISQNLTPWNNNGRLAYMFFCCTDYTLPYGNFVGQQGFIGVRFPIGASTHYGWIKFETPGDLSAGTVIDWAYETDDDTAINAGDTETPPTTTTTTVPTTTTTTVPTETTTTTTTPATDCTVTLTPDTIGTFKRLRALVIRGDDSISRDSSITWGAEGVKTLFTLPWGNNAVLAIVRIQPRSLSSGESIDVTVGDCAGQLNIKP